MRKIDQKKSALGKAAKTINFDKLVLEKLEERARLQHTTVSNLINMICRRSVLNDEVYYRELAKYHYLKFQEFNYMKEQSMIPGIELGE